MATKGKTGGGQGKTGKYIKFSWENVQLVCEWDGCNEESLLLSFYLKHVDDHMQLLANEPGEHLCLWSGCESEPMTREGLHCHVMYHAFHMKLKSHGQNVLKRQKRGCCPLGDKSKNFIPEIPEGLKCQWGYCNEYFRSPESFFRHVDIHAEEYPKGNCISKRAICQWQDCDAAFTSQYKLKEHFRAHTQEKMVACPTCGGMFASRTKLIDHIDRQSVGTNGKKSKTLYQCEYCLKDFASERILRDHMRCHVNHYKCPYCNMTCPTPSGMKSHILYRHSEQKHYGCPNCTYRAKSQNDLRKHMDTHNTSYYQCSDCDLKSRSEGALIHHIRRFHEEQAVYSCHICEKQFNRGAYLTKHLMKSHQLRWPSGHSRFRYKRDSDGYFRLQMVRYETIELSEQIQMLEEEKKRSDNMDESQQDYLSYSDEDPDDPSAVSPSQEGNEITDPLMCSPLVIYIPPASGEPLPIDSFENQFSESGLKQIQLLTTASDGSTVVQTAEVIAEGVTEN